MEIRQIQLRGDTAATWALVNPTMLPAEFGVETDTGRFKIGDGSTAWNALPYGRIDLAVSRTATTVTVGASGDDAVLPAATTTQAGVMSAADKSKLDGLSPAANVATSANNVFAGANEFRNATGQTFVGENASGDGLVISGGDGGSNGYRITVKPAALTASQLLLYPNTSGTLISSGDSGTVTSAMVANGTLVDGDINAAAGIAHSKLAAIPAGQLLLGNGSNVPTATALSGDVTVSAAGVTAIGEGVIVDGDINANAAIAGTKIVAGSTSGRGTVQLTNSTSSTSTSTAATPASVKAAFDLATAANTTANGALLRAGGTMDGAITFAAGQTFPGTLVPANIGSTVQGHAAPLADVAGLTPSDGGFIVGSGTNFIIESGATARASLGLGALATQSAAGNISAAGAIGTTSDLPIITGASGVLQAGAFGSGAGTFCQGNDSRLSDQRTPTDGSVTDVKVAAGAGIAHSKLAPIAAGRVLLGDAGNVATATPLSGDVSVSATGVVSLSAAGTAGTYTKVTTDAKGRVTGGTSLSAADVPTLTAAKISDFNTAVRSNRLDQLAAPTATVGFNGQRGTGLADPINPQDAATKAYVDTASQGLEVKDAVRVATTANLTLSGLQTVDGVALQAGDRVLVKNQTNAALNGLYAAGSGSWSRTIDADENAEVSAGLFVFVNEGTVNANSGWTLTTTGVITLGTTPLAFSQFSGAGQIDAGTGLTRSGSTLNVGGTAGRIVATVDAIDLATTGIAAGAYRSLTVDVYGRATNGTNPTTLAGYGITDAASSGHGHGNISNDGAIGTTSGLPVMTGTSGVLTTGTFSTVAGTFCQGNDSRLSDQRTPTDGSVTNSKVAAGAGIAHSKLAALAAGRVLLGNASGVATATALSGDVTVDSSGVTAIGAGKIDNGNISNSAGIVDTKLATIRTAGKVANSATTATSGNTANALVARDGSGNFSAGTITAALSGNAATATKLATSRTINGVGFDGSANINVPDLRASNGTVLVDGAGVTSAVNYVSLTNAAAGGTVKLSTAGSDTNIPFQITTKGTGSVSITTAGGNIALRPSAGSILFYDAANTYYTNLDNGSLTANRTLTMPNANVTLVGGTMVPTTGTGASGTWGISISGNAATSTTASNCTRSVVAGNGLTGGGDLSGGNSTLTLGTPGSISGSSTNSVTSTSHTHEISASALVADAGGIGSYQMARTPNTSVNVGGTIAGSGLQTAGFNGSNGTWGWTNPAYGGTWRCMSGHRAVGGSGVSSGNGGLWQRTA